VSSKAVVILGGGVGGIVVANELRRELPPHHRVIVVERNARHAFAPSFLWLNVDAAINLKLSYCMAEVNRCDPLW
jgi:sulfide:quinone oxidoreductase